MRLRGEVTHLPLTEHEYDALYHRAFSSSRKAAALAMGVSEVSMRHALTMAFRKLGVTDILSACRKMGWLQPRTWEQDDESEDDPRPYVPWP